ncbi:MAG TPA: DUF4253 domain-containing protein [Xanthobacteraceae bacterium]|nr:DUF4253 domain-containing protein [Xanthobacteraceae bacterium]
MQEKASSFEQRRAEWRTQALANFPFEIVETSGENAFAKWQQLKAAGRGAPVVVGTDVGNVLEPFHPQWPVARRLVAGCLSAASAIKFPEDLLTMRWQEREAALAALREAQSAYRFEDEHEPPLGEWPTTEFSSPGLSIAHDLMTGEPFPKVHIVLVPTDDSSTIPAHLHWGSWNECPAPEYHVAALRHWRDAYGAELVGLGRDTIDLKVARTPATRGEAIELARVQYAYCNDIIDQGTGSYSVLAAQLMAHDWWFFWWD